MNTPAFNSHKISEVLEHRPFNDFADQEFFAERCKVHDNLCPQFLPRKDRETLDEEQILQQRKGQLTLFLPQDLQLWEMMEIIRKIDHDTLKHKPEKQNERANQLLELGRKFEKSGLYFANFFPSDDKSEEAKLAQDLAQQFYSYGCSLQQKTKNSDALPRNISLSEEELSEVDQRLLGKQAYEKRLARLWENPSTDQLNAMRKELLTTAFKALKRDSSKEEWEKSRETKKGPYYKFQEKVQSQILRVIQTPETELYTAIFRRGKENLISNMLAPKGVNHMRNFLRKNLGVDLPFLKTKLTDALNLPILKSELEEVRKTGNKSLISAKELEIAKKVQEKVSSFDYQELTNIPSQMVESSKMNCLGAALLGGTFLEELDISYLAVDLPGHVSTILITSDGKWYRQDFTSWTAKMKRNYTEITPEIVENEQERIKLQEQKEGTLVLNWKPWSKISDHLSIYVSSPEKWLQSSIYNNQGIFFSEGKDTFKAKKSFKKSLQVQGDNARAYYNLGVNLRGLWRYDEEIQYYKKAIELDPNYVDAYDNLGVIYSNLEKYEDAIAYYQKAIELDANNANAHYNLGEAFWKLKKYPEAIYEYQTFIQLAGQKYNYLIEETKKEVEKLLKERYTESE